MYNNISIKNRKKINKSNNTLINKNIIIPNENSNNLSNILTNVDNSKLNNLSVILQKNYYTYNHKKINNINDLNKILFKIKSNAKDLGFDNISKNNCNYSVSMNLQNNLSQNKIIKQSINNNKADYYLLKKKIKSDTDYLFNSNIDINSLSKSNNNKIISKKCLLKDRVNLHGNYLKSICINNYNLKKKIKLFSNNFNKNNSKINDNKDLVLFNILIKKFN